MPRDDDRLDEHERRAEAKRRALDILDRPEHQAPPPDKEPLPIGDVLEEDHRNSKAVRGGGEPT